MNEDKATVDVEDAAFIAAQDAWEAKPSRDRRILSIRRHFFHTGYAAANGQSEAFTALYDAAKVTVKYSSGEGQERNFWLAIKALKAAIKSADKVREK